MLILPDQGDPAPVSKLLPPLHQPALELQSGIAELIDN